MGYIDQIKIQNTMLVKYKDKKGRQIWDYPGSVL